MKVEQEHCCQFAHQTVELNSDESRLNLNPLDISKVPGIFIDGTF